MLLMLFVAMRRERPMPYRSDKTFFDLSWQQRKVVAVGLYANALAHCCAKMQDIGIYLRHIACCTKSA